MDKKKKKKKKTKYFAFQSIYIFFFLVPKLPSRDVLLYVGGRKGDFHQILQTERRDKEG